MKILNIQTSPIRKVVLPVLLTGMVSVGAPMATKSNPKFDTFIHSENDSIKRRDALFPLTDKEELELKQKKASANIKPVKQENEIDLVKGTDNKEFLKKAPDARIKIAGKEKIAKFVVNISENRLYKYNNTGKAVMVYSICSGKKSTPTYKGVRIVTHIEKYPYSKAYGTKRNRHPKDYGPNIICLASIDVKTGKNLGSNGQFIHGNNNPESIGNYWSKGCMRMDNDVIQQLAQETKHGDLVLIK